MKSYFNKNKNLFNTEDIDISKILVSKKEPYGKKVLLDIMMMMSLDVHDVKKMSFDASDNKLLKNTRKYGKKLAV